jgi:hypothetical protein
MAEGRGEERSGAERRGEEREGEGVRGREKKKKKGNRCFR